MKIGLFFGSFNPIHVGHLVIGNHIVEHSELDQVWFVVTPLNPFKEKKNLLDNIDRLEMVYIATKNYDKLRECNIEFGLPQPNYTVDTLAYLEEKYPQHNFSLIMGEDNLNTLHKWKNYEVILSRYTIYVYPRLGAGESNGLEDHKNIKKVDAPIMEISATYIRDEIKAGRCVKPLLDDGVWHYIDKMGFYL